jgi:flagellar export protein FliJ
MPNALARLLRLRAAQADIARREVAAALRAHDVSGAQLASSRAALAHEARAASGAPGHELTGAYAAWLPVGQARFNLAQAGTAVTGQRLATARLTLTEARIAVRACETMAESHAAARRKNALLREQVALDDSIRRPAACTVMAAQNG